MTAALEETCLVGSEWTFQSPPDYRRKTSWQLPNIDHNRDRTNQSLAPFSLPLLNIPSSIPCMLHIAVNHLTCSLACCER